MPANSPERDSRTKKFQQINDAYYTLSDVSRRRDYDNVRAAHGFGRAGAGGSGWSNQHEDADEEVPRPEAGSAPGGFNWWSAFGFGGDAKNEGDANKFSNEQFGSVFEEMLRYVPQPR